MFSTITGVHESMMKASRENFRNSAFQPYSKASNTKLLPSVKNDTNKTSWSKDKIARKQGNVSRIQQNANIAQSKTSKSKENHHGIEVNKLFIYILKETSSLPVTSYEKEILKENKQFLEDVVIPNNNALLKAFILNLVEKSGISSTFAKSNTVLVYWINKYKFCCTKIWTENVCHYQLLNSNNSNIPNENIIGLLQSLKTIVILPAVRCFEIRKLLYVKF